MAHGYSGLGATAYSKHVKTRARGKKGHKQRNTVVRASGLPKVNAQLRFKNPKLKNITREPLTPGGLERNPIITPETSGRFGG